MILRLRKILQNGGIAIPSGRMSDQKAAVWSVLSSPTCPLLSEGSIDEPTSLKLPRVEMNARRAQRHQQFYVKHSDVHTRTYGIPVTKVESNDTLLPSKPKFRIENSSTPLLQPQEVHDMKPRKADSEGSSSLRDLIRAYSSRKKFTGDNEENIVAAISYYNIMCRICQISEASKLLGVPVMLDGIALDY